LRIEVGTLVEEYLVVVLIAELPLLVLVVPEAVEEEPEVEVLVEEDAERRSLYPEMTWIVN